ncbi:MAG: hypothetical protein JO328_07290 [Hyphomicrobiales bacterium]|nr:hypothetical protein [Hyphomicrobiales bacterium]MBV8824269.1 hypothetical protein [Hyphomicrobiales bacterium]MBV9428575.1 hypothetical protein [Bradyrhizobiaceae bacterium]
MSSKSPDAYYLSCYMSPPGPDSIVVPRHDQNVALWRVHAGSVELVRLWEFERSSGQKHHYWPLFSPARAEQFLGNLLHEVGVSLDDVTATWGTPCLPKQAPLVVLKNGAFPIHSLAHLFSGLLMDTALFKAETIVALAVDGGPDFALDESDPTYWYAGCVSKAGVLSLEPVESPAPLFAAAKGLFGYEPGTLMALASATTATMQFDCAKAIEDLELFGGATQPLTRTIPFVQGVMREAQRQRRSWREADQRFTDEENLQSAVMKVIQECSELVMKRNIARLCRNAGIAPNTAWLSLSGGFALNCPANSRLIDHFGFKGLLAPPCASDSGQAMGLGLLGLYQAGAFAAADFRMTTAYHGSSELRLEEALDEFEAWIEDVSDFDAARFVADIRKTPLIWIDGAAEIGPRALGHRSVLGDPRSNATRDILNAWKGRQWWRPVAPIVLEEHANDWFEFTRASPYMLEIAAVRPEKRDVVPAIAHLDNSARLQTLNRAADERLHAAIDAFRAAVGVPILCNTSLNDKGEPIVATAGEALNFCLRKGARLAYAGGRRIQLRPGANGKELPFKRPAKRDVQAFAGQEQERDQIWSDWLGRGYSEHGLFLLSRSPKLRNAAGRLATPEQINQLAAYGVKADPGFGLGSSRYVDMFGPSAAFSDEHGPLPVRWKEFLE